MVSIRDSIQTNRRVMFFIATLLIIIIALLTKFYFTERQQNRALKIKILSMNENKRNPKPWSQLTTSKIKTTVSLPSATPTTTKTENVSLAEQDTQALAIKLDRQMKRVKNAEVNILDDNIAIANELISREPDSYGAYKAKLISMLVKEGKFSQPADEGEIESALESMAQFNISSDKIARREAGLMASTNEGIQNNEIQLEELSQSHETLESQLTTLDPNSPEMQNLNDQILEVENKQAELMANISALEENLSNNTNQLVNEDVVEIPFMRMLAQNDYEAVGSNAQNFIEQFPNSPNGYFYLVRSLELQGQKDQARAVIETAKLAPESREDLIKRLEQESTQDPKNYWQKLNF